MHILKSTSFLAALTVAIPASSQMPMMPAFNGAIVNGPGMMAMGMQASGGGSQICGRAYSNDLEKAELLRREASGQCSASSLPMRQFAPQLFTSSTRPSMAASAATERGLKFAPSLILRKANLASFVAKSRASDPAGSAQMAQLFASTDPIVALGRDLQPYGLRTDNVADAYTVYWVQAWQAANGDTSDPSRATMQAVKRQSASALAATSEFAAATDATKQEMAEAMMVQAMLISASVDVYKDDPNMMRQLGAAVRKGAKASGLDLDAMTLTDEGFVPARKTGAVAGKGDTRLAGANTGNAPVTNDNSPPYLLMAAAGGVGVGGVFLIGKAIGRRG